MKIAVVVVSDDGGGGEGRKIMLIFKEWGQRR
jgi:hypothetical protein